MAVVPSFLLVRGHGGDCLLLLLRLDGTGSLGDFTGADRLVLEECVVPVRDHGAIAEERRRLERLRIGGRRQRGSQHVQQRPRRTKVHLYLEPRNLVELFAHVKQIEDQHNSREPEAHHRHGIEERPPRVIAEVGNLDADESDEVEHHGDDFDDARDGPDVLGIVPDVRLGYGCGLRDRRGLRVVGHGTLSLVQDLVPERLEWVTILAEAKDVVQRTRFNSTEVGFLPNAGSTMISSNV